MITIKNSAQIAKMREAGAMLHEVLTQLRGKIQPGVTTYELDQFAEKLIRSFGAIPSFLKGFLPRSVRLWTVRLCMVSRRRRLC